MARTLGDVRSVSRIEVPDRREAFLFRVVRHNGTTLHVAWERREPFSGEDLPDTELRMRWSQQPVRATDAFGATVAARVDDGALHLPLSATPVYLEFDD
jgi:hypothetical protein